MTYMNMSCHCLIPGVIRWAQPQDARCLDLLEVVAQAVLREVVELDHFSNQNAACISSSRRMEKYR